MAETLEEYKQRIARSGGYGRAENMTAKQRKDSASKAAKARWAKIDKTLSELEKKNAKRTKVKKAAK